MIDEQTNKRRGSVLARAADPAGRRDPGRVLVRAFVLQTFYIPSASMEHTLNINDRVLVNKLVYDFREPAPRRDRRVQGARRQWRSGPDERGLHQAGHRRRRRPRRVLRRPAAAHRQRARARRAVHLHATPTALSDAGQPTSRSTSRCRQGRLWVMGDHRSHSGDSLEHWQQHRRRSPSATIPADSVVGRAFVVFWPVGRATWLSVPDDLRRRSRRRRGADPAAGGGRSAVGAHTRLGRVTDIRPPARGAGAAGRRRRAGPAVPRLRPGAARPALLVHPRRRAGRRRDLGRRAPSASCSRRPACGSTPARAGRAGLARGHRVPVRRPAGTARSRSSSCVRVTSWEVDTAGLRRRSSRRTIDAHRWWSADGAASHDERFYPPELPDLLACDLEGCRC